MILLLGAISLVIAFGTVVLLRLVIRLALRLTGSPRDDDDKPGHGLTGMLAAPEYRTDRIALAASAVLLVLLLGLYALILMQS